MIILYKLQNDSLEYCYNIELYEDINNKQLEDIYNTFFLLIGETTFTPSLKENIVEYGPKLNYETPWCSNVLQIFRNCNIYGIKRVEMSYRVKNIKSSNYDPLIHSIYDTPLKSFDIDYDNIKTNSTEVVDLNTFKYQNLGIDKFIFNHYKKVFKNKKVTNVELFDLAQSNSEHARHHFFNGIIHINYGDYLYLFDGSLMKCVKSTNSKYNEDSKEDIKDNSIIAFKDNASAIRGFEISKIFSSSKSDASKYEEEKIMTHLTHNAETHNFPTGICPFPGAATGTGGRIRDTIAIGRGGGFLSGIVGYSVGDIHNTNWLYPYNHPKKILIEASNGASDYGNKIGEPVTSGFTRSFGALVNNERIEYVKPILYSASNGYLYDKNKDKMEPDPGYLIVRVGGPAYCIGIGGGAASSTNQDTKNKNTDYDAVQRGDPEMENKVCKFIRACCELKDNPIYSIHDQGSGGMANVTKEIVEPNGGMICINNVNCGQKNMTPFEIWNAEYQEQCTFLTSPKHVKLVKNIAQRENVNLEFVGFVTNTKRIQVYDKNEDQLCVDMNLKEVLNDIPQKVFIVEPIEQSLNKKEFSICFNNLKFNEQVFKVLNDLNVCSKKFLTNKVDRSVTGLISQQQCVGPFQLPLSNYSITNISFRDLSGIVSALGEQPLKGIKNIYSMIDMTIGELLTNMIFAKVESLNSIKVLTNWMWSINIKTNDYLLMESAKYLTEQLKKLNIAIDGGKDSLFMNSKVNWENVMSPNTLVLKSIAPSSNITQKVTPNFKKPFSSIIYIDINDKLRLGGSIFYKVNNKLGNFEEQPKFDNIMCFKYIWDIIQELVEKNLILSGHDRSDGGLITTLVEMAISSNYGFEIFIENNANMYEYFFNEELGLVIEVEQCNLQKVINILKNLNYFIIGKTTRSRICSITYNNKMIMNEYNIKLWKEWEKTSYQLEKEQCNLDCVEQEYSEIENRHYYEYKINEHIIPLLNEVFYYEPSIYTVGIVRTNGSNGEIEMANVLYESGFIVFDVTMTDIIKSRGDLIKQFNGLIFVGGFSYSDVLGSASGWALSITSNKDILNNFIDFYKDESRFSMGICNGCQLLSKIGWIPNCKLVENKSKRFESRYVSVKVENTNNIFTKNMDDTIFGMWLAHGEGQFVFENEFEEEILNLSPLRYVDDYNIVTEKYPYNPNGSKFGIAAICSKNGNHIGIMPHPERSYKSWQMAYISDYVPKTYYTPWYMLFRNAYLHVSSIKQLK